LIGFLIYSYGCDPDKILHLKIPIITSLVLQISQNLLELSEKIIPALNFECSYTTIYDLPVADFDLGSTLLSADNEVPTSVFWNSARLGLLVNKTL